MTKPSTQDKFRWVSVAGLALLAGLVGALAISRQSFWMDEAGMAFKAIMPNFELLKFMTFRVGGSDAQMPLYLIILFSLFGTVLGSHYV